jgi:hypothetical protein
MHDIKVSYGGVLLRLLLEEGANVRTLDQRLSEREDLCLPANRQLVANGAEMEMDTLISSLGPYFFNRNCIYLREINNSVCREWQRVGRCNQGPRCPYSDTHNMNHSPRYVAHLQPQNNIPECSTTEMSPITESSSNSVSTLPVTTICRNWAAHGHCQFGERCHFAATHTAANLPHQESTDLWHSQSPDSSEWTTNEESWQYMPHPVHYDSETPNCDSAFGIPSDRVTDAYDYSDDYQGMEPNTCNTYDYYGMQLYGMQLNSWGQYQPVYA